MATGVFRFLQFEVPFAVGPPDGRWLLRPAAGGAVERVIVLRTVGTRRADAPSRRRRARVEPSPANATDEPGPEELDPLAARVQVTRATVIDTTAVADEHAARAWLAALDSEAAAADAVQAVNRLVAAHRLASADPHARPLAVKDALVLRAGFGAGEEVADGRWREAVVLHAARRSRRHRRRAASADAHAQQRTSALVGGRAEPLLCAELALRARLDLDGGRTELAAVELERACAAAVAELRAQLPARAQELGELLPAVAQLADAALRGARLAAEDGEALEHAASRLEAALRAHVATADTQ